MSSQEFERREPFQRVARAGWLAVVLLLVGVLALWVRTKSAIGVGLDPPGAAAVVDGPWGSYDPDTLYHARRVERGVRDHGWVASYDPLLASGAALIEPRSGPDALGSNTLFDPTRGVPIPWPPFYDLLLTGIYRRALPSTGALMRPKDYPSLPPLDRAERGRLERFVASVPLLFGTLTAVLVALIAAGRARRLAGQRMLETGVDPTYGSLAFAGLVAAAVAGVGLALNFSHIRYSHLGNGDHHAFISCLSLGMLGIAMRALDHERIVQPFWSAVRGALAGLLAAAMITSWTASIALVAALQLAMVLRLVVPFRAADGRRFSARGLPVFATSFHKAALLGVVPAVIDSPFSNLKPWSLVELSWLHLVWLSVGWLIFAPYALMPKTAAKSQIVAFAPATLVALTTIFLTSAGDSLRSALSWASADNSFMSSINESKSLLGLDQGLSSLLKFGGIGVLALPVIFLSWLRAARRMPSLLPLLTALPVLAVAALLQRRFAESLAGPMAVALGAWLGAWLGASLASGAATLAARRARNLFTPIKLVAAVLLGAAVSAALNPWTLRNTGQFLKREAATGSLFPNASPISAKEAALAHFLLDLAADEEPPPSVLAHWDLGHNIEWRANLATVATNFGLYIGRDAFLDPWRFFATTDPIVAERIMAEREVRYVLMDGDRNRAAMAAALDVDLVGDPDLWRQTMAARLLRDGAGAAALPVPGFLALVAAQANGVGGTIELYERVEGAIIEAPGAKSLKASATIRGRDGTQVSWRVSVTGPSGEETLRLRVPYASSSVVALAIFVDGSEADLKVSEEAVREGTVLVVRR